MASLLLNNTFFGHPVFLLQPLAATKLTIRGDLQHLAPTTTIPAIERRGKRAGAGYFLDRQGWGKRGKVMSDYPQHATQVRAGGMLQPLVPATRAKHDMQGVGKK